MVSGILFFGSSEDRFQRNLDGPDKMPCRQRPAGGFLAVVRKKRKAGEEALDAAGHLVEALSLKRKEISGETPAEGGTL